MLNFEKSTLKERNHEHQRINSPDRRVKMQPSILISKLNRQSNIHCSNHANKQAAFCSTIGQKEYFFCEKCALSLATQGCSLHKIQMNNNKLNLQNRNQKLKTVGKLQNQREKEIIKFIRQLYELKGTLQQTKQTIFQKLIESQQFYGDQLQEVNDYFSLIIKSLQLQKHKCYNHILSQRLAAQQHIRAINEDLYSIDNDICKIVTDIQDNLQTVYSIYEDMYQIVLSQYKEQKEYFYQSINGILLLPIQLRKIQFEGVPQSIYSISDLLIQNSVINKQNQQYKLYDSLNAQGLNYMQAANQNIDISHSPQYKTVKNGDNLKFSFRGESLRGSVLKQLQQNQQFPKQYK